MDLALAIPSIERMHQAVGDNNVNRASCLHVKSLSSIREAVLDQSAPHFLGYDP